MTLPDARLSFVFPMWNEEAMIRRTVAAAQEAGERLVGDGQVAGFEIVLVDDASTDGTGKIADELAHDDPRIEVVHHPENRTLGGALKSGFATATGEFVLYTDADLPCELVEVDKALRLLRLYDADIVSAYRFDRTAEGPQRTVYSFVYNHLVRWALGVRVRDDGPELVVSVEDHGIGIPKADQGRIFERFYKVDRARVRGGGTGLGLSIARNVLQQHGGRIWVESEEGVGSTFSFALPVPVAADADSAH